MVGYTPSPEQELFHKGLGWGGYEVPFKLATGGEQSGKSYSAAMELFSKILWGKIFWVVSDTYDNCREEMNYLRIALETIGALDFDSVSMPDSPGSWRLATKTGIKVRTISAEDERRIARESPDGILMVEAARCSEEALWRCYGRTGPAGGWLCINGTLEGSTGWFPKLSKEWTAPNTFGTWGARAFKIPAWSNLSKYPGGRQDPKILALEKTMPPDMFAERVAGEAVPPRGLVFPAFKYSHHVRPIFLGNGHNPEAIYLPESTDLQLWVDPGFGEGYSILVAAIHREQVYILDEVYTTNYTTKEMIQICKQKWWWSRISHVVMDIAGEQHHANESAAEIWRSRSTEGAGLKVVGKKIPNIKDKLDLVASYLVPNPLTGQPKILFSTQCPKTVEEFGDKYKWRLGPDGEKLGHKPIEAHDHSVSAIAYGLNMNFGYVHKERPEKKPAKQFWEYRKR